MGTHKTTADDFETEERRENFNKWWRKNMQRFCWNMLPSYWQGLMHDMVKAAYYAGSNYEKQKHEPISLGGAI